MAIDWNKIPIVQKDMYDTWERFSIGNQNAAKAAAAKFTNPSVPTDCVYAYDAANDRVYNAINTTSLVGLVCPDQRDVNYVFDGQLSVFGGGDNDPIGFVIAFVKLPNGEYHTLTAIRSMFGQVGPNRETGYWVKSPMTIVKDYMTHAPKAIAESWGVLKFYNDRIVTEAEPWVPAGESNPSNGWVGLAPKGVHIRVVREGDIITVSTSQLNDTILVPEAMLTIDLSKDPELEMFRTRSQYGFCSVSQDRVFWTGEVQHPKLETPYWLSDVHAMYGTHGWMSDAAEAGGVWKRDPVDLKEVFENWDRFSRGDRGNVTMQLARMFTDDAKPNERDAFTYDEAKNRIGNPLNTDTLVGFMSPDAFTEYMLDVTITSLSTWQVDPVGLVLAKVTDPDGTAHTLTLMRCGYATPVAGTSWMKDDAPMQLAVDYATHAQITIAKGYYGLRFNGGKVPTAEDPLMQHPGGSGGSTDWGFNKFPNGVRIVITRNKDIFTIATSQYNETVLHPGAVMSVDLNSHPSLARFKAACQYGFCCISQDYVSWDATIRPGGWRRPFWLSEFGKLNDYIRQVRGPFSRVSRAAGSASVKYQPAKHGPIDKPLDVILPLQGFVGADPGYTFDKDATVIGSHITVAEMTALGLNPDHAVCLQRPSVAEVSFKTAGQGAVGYMLFHKDTPFQNPVGIAFFDTGDMQTLGTKTIKLPQPAEDMLIIPYIVSDQPVANITFTIHQA